MYMKGMAVYTNKGEKSVLKIFGLVLNMISVSRWANWKRKNDRKLLIGPWRTPPPPHPSYFPWC